MIMCKGDTIAAEKQREITGKEKAHSLTSVFAAVCALYYMNFYFYAAYPSRTYNYTYI